MKNESTIQPVINAEKVSKKFIIFNVVLTLVYFSWWFTFDHIENIYLYSLLFIGEIYHVLMLLMFWFTIKNISFKQPQAKEFKTSHQPTLAAFVTVAGEPVDIVRNTILSIKNTGYKNMKIYILNDSYVAQKSNWREYEQLAKDLGIKCITRRKPGGAKAGNINNALRKTKSDLVAIFDADMRPDPDFFRKTVPYFIDPNIGFVQTPQYYENHQTNTVTASAWQQQEFFFGPILRGKNNSNAAFICGTNVVIKREALVGAGGMNETSIAEDFLTSLYIHKHDWKSIYVPEVLSKGLAPEDLMSYYKQQLRWARGSLEILFLHNPLFSRNLSISQKIEYLASSLFYLNGVIVLINMVIPLIFLYFGISPIKTTTTIFALYFLPFMLSIIYCLHAVSGRSLTLGAISFTQSSWYLQIQALISLITGKKMGFSVTSKTALKGNFLFLAYPHLIYTAIAIFGAVFAIYRMGVSPAVITNISWVVFNIVLFIPFIKASLPTKEQSLVKNITPIFSNS